MMDQRPQVCVVASRAPSGTACQRPVQGQVDSLKKGCFPGAVQPADEHDRPARLRRGQRQRVAASEDPDIVQDQLVEDHDITVPTAASLGDPAGRM